MFNLNYHNHAVLLIYMLTISPLFNNVLIIKKHSLSNIAAFVFIFMMHLSIQSYAFLKYFLIKKRCAEMGLNKLISNLRNLSGPSNSFMNVTED